MKPYARAFYKSAAWEACRRAYLKKVASLCERCLKEGRYTPAEIVHHKIYLTAENIKDPSVALNFDNLEALCMEHHNREHFGTPGRRYIIDKQGRATALE